MYRTLKTPPGTVTINNSVKLQDNKISTEKSVVFLYTNNEIAERENKETVLFTTASKRILKNNFNQGSKRSVY